MPDNKPTPKPDEKPAAVHSDAPKTEDIPNSPTASQPHETTMTDAERQELERYRTEKAEAEAKRAAELAGKPYWFALPRDEQIRDHYIHARATIQEMARVYKLTVEKVLEILDLEDVGEVQTIGDQIDASELGPGDAPINSVGKSYKVPFTTD